MSEDGVEYNAGRERLKEDIDDAQEAEADLDRHYMEEAVLATLATAAWDKDQVAQAARTINWSRADFGAIASALTDAVTELGVTDRILIEKKLRSARIRPELLADIMEGKKAKDVSVILEYVEIMHTQDKTHAAKAFGREYLKAIESGDGDLDAAFADLIKKVFSLAKEKKLFQDYPVEMDAAKDFLDTLNDRRQDGRSWSGLDCGLSHLNEVFNGLGEGVYILSGAPSCGKTTLAKQIADTVAVTEKVPVLFYSYEQSAEELRIKSLSRLASVNSRAIWKGRTGSKDWQKIEEAAGKYLTGPGPFLTVIEAGRTDTVDAIRATALMAKRRVGDRPILVVLDYLQIIPAGKGAPDNIREKVDYNLSELRRLSRDIKSPIIVISSQNREGYRENKTPTLSAMKESGGIEYSADAVICLWRDKDGTNNVERERKTHYPDSPSVIRIKGYVLKNRNGELTTVLLDFTPAWSMFSQTGKEDLSYAAALGE